MHWGALLVIFFNSSLHRALEGRAYAFGYEAEIYDQEASRLLARSKAYAAAGTCMLLEPMIIGHTGISTRFGLAFFAYAASS